jgi:putative ABC transport system ATP-binding protein
VQLPALPVAVGAVGLIGRIGVFVAVDKARALLKVIEKIPMFKNLGAENARRVLMGCEFRQAVPWQVLCRHKDASDELYILLSGQLAIYNGDNVELAVVKPVAPVGEMGLITGEARSATVKVIERAKLLVLRKAAFDSLMRSHGPICLQVYCNVVQIMGQRLQASQKLHVECSRELADKESHLRYIEDEIGRLRHAKVAS